MFHWVHIGERTRHNFTLSLEFVPQDLWMGVYWKQRPAPGLPTWRRFDVYVCVLPTLPIHLVYYRPPTTDAASQSGD